MSKTTLVLDSQALSTYQACPRKYKFSFIDNIESTKTKEALNIGTCFHELFEYVNKGLIEGGKQLGTLVIEALQNTATIKNFESDQRLFIVKRFVEYYKHWEVENSNYELVAAEEGFSKILYEDDRFLFVYEGRIDAVLFDKRNKIYIWRDYKTGQWVYPHNNQFLGYIWALSKNEKMAQGQVDYISKEKKYTPTTTFSREYISFTQSQIDRWKENTISTFYDILQDKTHRKRLTTCQSRYGVCSFSKLCERTEAVHEALIRIEFKPKKKWSAW